MRRHTALIQLVGVAGCVVPLLFSDQVPVWAVYGSLAALVLLLVSGRLLAGRFAVRTPVDFPVLLLLLLLPLNLLITADRSLTLPHVYKVIASVALFYGVAGVLEEKAWFGLAAGAISVLGIALGGILLLSTHWPSKLSFLPSDLAQRIPLLFNPFWKPEGFAGFNPNLAGGTLALLLPVPVAYGLFGRRSLIRLGALLEAGVLSILLLLTQSRGAIAGLVVGILAMLVARDRRWFILVAILAIGVVLSWDAIVGDDQPIALNADAEGVVRSIEGRMELWSRGLYMLQDFPFTGIGLGMVVKVLPLLYPTFLISIDAGVEHLHNIYLHTGAEQGYPGLIAMLAFLLGIFYLCWRSARRARSTAFEPLALGILGTVVVFAVHGAVETIPFSPKASVIVWALFGVAAAMGAHLMRRDMPSAVETSEGAVARASRGRIIDG
jgi:putative inorganic carbon (HCO3(-)) transporter